LTICKQAAVERQHGCTATLAQSVPVKETFDGATVSEGVVHVFDIHGHLGLVGIQDSHRSWVVIQALDGPIRFD
jgi:hypothetical protein